MLALMTKHVLELFRLDNKVALITGGSKGLGQAMALALAQAGCDLVITSRSESDLQGVAQSIRDGTGRKVVPVAANVRSWEDAQRVVATALDSFGKLDILVNNAGMNNRKAIHEMRVEEFGELIDVNLTGMFRMSKAVAETFMAQKSGRVINLSSMLDHVTIPGRTGYSSSKGGVLMFTKTLALEWAPLGIRVNAVSPGPFATPMNQALLDDPERNEEFLQKLPVGRWGKPYEIGAAAVYLASEASDFMTGSTLYIDGGWTAQ